MPRCEVCGVNLPNPTRHSFAGYGWYVTYCEEHCPRELDGTVCEYHPDVVDTEDKSTAEFIRDPETGAMRRLK